MMKGLQADLYRWLIATSCGVVDRNYSRTVAIGYNRLL